MKKPSVSASAVKASTTLEIDAAFKKMKSEGIDVVGFAAGEPDFSTPDNIKEAGKSAIDLNCTKYTPAAGLPALKKAICDRMNSDLSLDYEPSEVIVSNGAKQSVFLSIMALTDPGDEVLIISPYWISYYEMIRSVHGVPIVVETNEAQGFKATECSIRTAITSKTKALIINNPSNPSGMLYDEKHLRRIMDVCMEAGIYVIADEIYCKLCYDDSEFVSCGALDRKYRDFLILINGVSKSYAMTGWRIGWSLSSKSVAAVIGNLQSHATAAPSTISQMAALEALNGPQDTIKLMAAEFELRRNYIYNRINSISGVSCIKPQGAFYVLMNIRDLIGKSIAGETIKSDDDFAKLFLKHGLVSVVPTSGFGLPGYIRWSYAASMDSLIKGMDRLELFVKELK